MNLPHDVRVKNESTMPWAKSSARQATNQSIGKTAAGTATNSSLTLAPIDVRVTRSQPPEISPDFESRDEDLNLPKDPDPWSIAHANDISADPLQPDIEESSISDYGQEFALAQAQSAEAFETEFATSETQRNANPVTLEPSETPPDYNPRRPFHIAIGTLLLSASAYAGYLWWELQPRDTQPVAATSRADTAADTSALHSNPATQSNNGPVNELTPTNNTPTTEITSPSNTSLGSTNTRRGAVPDQKNLQNQFPLAEGRNISVVDHNPGNSNGTQTQPLAEASDASSGEQNTKTLAQPATVIQLQKKYAAPEIEPGIKRAFSAYQSGQLDIARQEYEAVLQKDGRNRDALLALAILDARRGELDLAELRYQRILEIDPRDMQANAALFAIRGRNSPLSESRIKYLLSIQPESAPLNFVLGNLLASGKRWPEAQAAYFRAYVADPDNADYAFNLAVSLDQLRQPRGAINYYQRALDLSRNTASDSYVGFNQQSLLVRIRELQRR